LGQALFYTPSSFARRRWRRRTVRPQARRVDEGLGRRRFGVD
jgi:hypothetical protein